jgi:hypothetical protein
MLQDNGLSSEVKNASAGKQSSTLAGIHFAKGGENVVYSRFSGPADGRPFDEDPLNERRSAHVQSDDS